MHQDLESVLFSEEEIRDKIAELGEIITKDYAGKHPFILGLLKGCFIFMADMCRQIKLPCDIDFMSVSSYGSGTSSTGAVKITKDLSRDIEGRDVLILEDVLDSGNTLYYIKNYLAGRKPASIKICTLLDKPFGRQSPVQADYVGFTCPDGFVVGFGLDYAERYRNLPYVGVLKPEIYSK